MRALSKLSLFCLCFWVAVASFTLVSIEFASAQTTDTSNLAFLEKEAGMATYVNLNQSLDIAKAKSVFKTVEKESQNYILGRVPLSNLPESDEVYAYIQRSGLILVYYPKGEPVSRILDLSWYSDGKIAKTKLEVGVEEISNVLGLNATSPLNYYHFQYPAANKVAIIFESQYGEGQTGIVESGFNLKIPSSFTVFERSWWHAAKDVILIGYSSFWGETRERGYSNFKLDGTTADYIYGSGTNYGQLTTSQLSLGIFHNITVTGGGSGQAHTTIGLVYKEPTDSSPSNRIAAQYADSIYEIDMISPLPITQPTNANEVGDTTPLALKLGEPILDLYGHRTNVRVGEEVVVYLSVVNPITSLGTLTVQITLQIPSGWSVTSTGFSPSVGGLTTGVFSIKQGQSPQSINVNVLANEPYEGVIVGYLDYYFIGNETTGYHKAVSLPVTAKTEAQTNPSNSNSTSQLSEDNSSSESANPVIPEWVTIIALILAIVAVAIAICKKG